MHDSEVKDVLDPSINKTRRVSGDVLIIFGGVLLLGSSAAKFAHMGPVVRQLGAMGFEGSRLTLIAGLELVSAALFLIRPTRSAGLLLVSAYLGGAIAAHVGHSQSPVQPAFVLTLLWVGTWLRHPEILWSLHSETMRASHFASASRRQNAPGAA